MRRYLLSLLIAFAVFAGGSTPAPADKVQDAKGLIANGDYKALFAIWRDTFERGDTRTRSELLDAFQKGKGLDAERAKAQAWFLSEAAKGDPEVQTDLGMAMEDGFIFDPSPDQAREWYLKAALQGYARGQTFLGVCFDRPCGGVRDYKQARLWYEKAALQGDARGQRLLARLYEFGYGGSINAPEAERWYLAARNSYRRLLDQGVLFAAKPLADLYYDGRGGPKDDNQARSLYTVAAGIGNDDGQAALGYMIQNGYGGAPDLDTAISWYRKSADSGNPMGQFYLGTLYENGTGLPKDPAEALKLYQSAVDGSARFYISLHMAAMAARDRVASALKSPDARAASASDAPAKTSAEADSSAPESNQALQSEAVDEASPPAGDQPSQTAAANDPTADDQLDETMASLVVARRLLADNWTVPAGLAVIALLLGARTLGSLRRRRQARDLERELRAFQQRNDAKLKPQASSSRH